MALDQAGVDVAATMAVPADNRREDMLRAALDVIAERGFTDTRIADVAKRAGTSPALVIYYFQTKDNLLTEAVRLAEDRWYEQGVQSMQAITGCRRPARGDGHLDLHPPHRQRVPRPVVIVDRPVGPVTASSRGRPGPRGVRRPVARCDRPGRHRGAGRRNLRAGRCRRVRHRPPGPPRRPGRPDGPRRPCSRPGVRPSGGHGLRRHWPWASPGPGTVVGAASTTV